MDIVIGNHSFKAETLKKLSKSKAINTFKDIDNLIIERAWQEANKNKAKPKSKKRSK